MSDTLLNVFIVPRESEAEFLRNWRETAAFFSKRPGFLETHMHRNTGVGNGTFRFINIAAWESAAAWHSNHDAYKPGEYSVPGVKGHPAIYERVVEVRGGGEIEAQRPVTLLNVFTMPDGQEAEFLRNWKETTEHFRSKKGFIETHLHRNTGFGNQTHKFVNIARWESPEAWRSNHDDYKPGEYNVPGVKGHPAIFECVADLYVDPPDELAKHQPFIREGFFPGPRAA